MASLAFNPVLTGPLLAYLIYDPSTVGRLTTLGPHAIRLLSQTVGALFVAGALCKISKYLDRLAINNWTSKTPKWKWDEEIVVVTGGCSGIGKAITQILVAKGVQVAVLDVTPLPEDLAALGGDKVLYVQCDISSKAEVDAAAAHIRKTLGHPSVLINNAAVGGGRVKVVDISEETLRQVFDVNVVSHWTTIQAFLPEMVKRNKGHVLALGSLSGFSAMANGVHYSAAKAGVLALHEGLTAEITKHHKAPGVKTTLVTPHWLRTPMTEDMFKFLEKRGTPWGFLKTEDVAGRIVKQIMSGRGGGVLIIPHSKYWFAPVVRGLPEWMQSMVRARQ